MMVSVNKAFEGLEAWPLSCKGKTGGNAHYDLCLYPHFQKRSLKSKNSFFLYGSKTSFSVVGTCY